MTIEMKPVQSSHINEIGYDAANRKLIVSYRGRRTAYSGVPADVAETVMESPSVGKAIHLWIRGNYDFAYEDERNAGSESIAGEAASE